MSVIAVSQQKEIEGKMMGLMRELEKLAPHPDHPAQTGPLFVQIDGHIKPAAEYDGMLGSMMLESFLGTAFSEVSAAQSNVSPGSWTQAFSQIDWSSAADASSEYVSDRARKQSYKLGQRSAISGSFNKSVAREHLMKAYLRDLPRRLGIEKWLADYQRKLYALQKHAPMAESALAA